MQLTGFARMALCLSLVSAVCGCVTLPSNAPRSKQDPWESWNRGVYRVNDKLDRAIAKPVARGYVKVVPSPLRTGITNFFSNLRTTTVMINDALQGKFSAAGNDLGRFLLNTTVGLGGLLDPATPAGLAVNNEDFGQTLGKWGVKPGPFIEIPILGPSDLRDAPSRVVDMYTNPTAYIGDEWIRWGLVLPDFTDQRAQLLPLDDSLKNVYDPYAVIRDAYLQRRAYLVSDGAVSDEPLIDPDAEDPNVPTPQGAAAPDVSPTQRNPQGDKPPPR